MAKRNKDRTNKVQKLKHESSHLLPPTLPPFINNHFWKFYLALCIVLSFLFVGRALFPGCILFGTDFVTGDLMTRKFLNDHPGAQWQPYVFGGVPFDDAGPGDKYYPFSILIRLSQIIPYYSEIAWLYMIHFALSGILTYLLARQLGLGKVPSALSGLAYMFTGQIVSLIYAGHVGKIIVSSLFPGMFLFILRGIQMHRLREFVWGGMIMGFALLSAHIPMTYYALFAVGLFWFILTIWKWPKIKSWKTSIKLAGGFAIFLIVGFALSSIFLLSFYQYLPFSPRGAGEGRGIEFAKSWSMPPEEIIDTVIPDFSGMSIGNTSYDTYWGQNVFKLHSEYLGVLPVLLAILGILLGWRGRYERFFFGLLILGLLFAWGGYTPFFTLFYNLLPYYKKLRAGGMAFFIVSFSIACLAGFGAEGILRRAGEEEHSKGSKAGNRGLTLGLGIAAGASLLLTLIVFGARDGLIQALGNAYVSESIKYQMLQANYDHFVRGTFLFALFLILHVILLILLLKQRLPKIWWTGLAIGLLIIDLWRIGARYRQYDSPSKYVEPDQVARVLRSDSAYFRVFPLHYNQIGNYLNLFNIQTILGEHPNPLQRYNEFVGTGQNRRVDGHNLISKPNYLNLLNAKYLITAYRAEELVARAGFLFPRLRLASDGQFKVYENQDVLPRAYCVRRYEVIPDADKILARIDNSQFDPRRTAIVEKDPGFPSALSDSMEKDTTSIIKYSPNEVILSCQTKAPSLLVLLDNYYPSWKAYVDNQPTKVLRTNYTFRGVVVPVGQHRVVYRFESSAFRLGLAITLLTFFFVILMTTVFFIKRIRNL